MVTLRTRLAAALLATALGVPALAAAASGGDIHALIAAREDDAARAEADALSADPAIASANRQFVEALIARRDGRAAEAARLMRAILDAHPGYARVRHELAMTLLLEGETEGAAHHFEVLAGSVTDDGQRATYRTYLRAIAAQRPWRFDVGFGVLPGTNVNNASSGKIVVVNGVPLAPTQTAQSGVGVTGAASGSYAFEIGEGARLTLGGTLNGRFYERHDVDLVVAGTFAELSRTAGPVRVGFGVGAERVLDGWEGYRFSYGPQGAIGYDFGRNGVVTLSGQIRRHDFDAGYGETEYLAGVVWSAMLRDTVGISAGLDASRYLGNAPFNSHQSVKPSVGFSAELPHGLIVSGRLSYQMRTFEGAIPFIGTARDDGTLEASASVTFGQLDLAGFSPRLDYSFSLTDSETDLFDQESHSVGLSLTRSY